MKKPVQEESRFSKKAADLSARIVEHYKKDNTNTHPYSFSANRYRISLVIGVILMIYGLFRFDSQKATNQPECGVVNKISDTVSNGKQSISVLYDIYKDWGLQAVSDLTKIKANKPNQNIHIDFSKIKTKASDKNILICKQPVSAKIGSINKKNNILEYRTVDFLVGDVVDNNQILSNSFLKLSENDDVVVAIDDNLEEANVNLVYISDIKTPEKYNLGFYDFNIIEYGTDKFVQCDSDIKMFYNIAGLTDESYKMENNIDIKIGHKTPIILDRTLVGNYYNGKFRIITKLKNICVFKEGIMYDLCDSFWKIQNSKNNANDVIILEITTK
jgi:hypothetical protein